MVPHTILRRIVMEEPAVYDWVILVSGKGHLNMNQLKTFFKVLDHVCGDILGNDVLQSNTPKSYKYFIDCKKRGRLSKYFSMVQLWNLFICMHHNYHKERHQV